MKWLRALVIALFALTTLGCASMLGSQHFTFDTGKGKLTFVRHGCVLTDGQFTDSTGRGNSFPYFTFISVNANGNTLDEFTASCNAVAGNGTSNCNISGHATFAYYGGLACPNLNDFRIFR